ncbi:MAG TPA: ABC transporter substrate-binding protein [Vicinamibacterales bacterium]|nr:ABC transporter substrate-binding protein [Vicinamibacterales bacterium]
MAIVAAAGVCAPGCARQPPGDPPLAVRIGIGAPIGTPGSGAGTVVASLVSDPWVTNKPDGRQAERIAKSWEWDSTGTRLRLKLRDDVLFHDGTRLTPEIGAEALRLTKARRDAVSFVNITSIEPVGPDTIEITLPAPNSFILPDLTAVLVVKPGQPEIGTGPFKFASQTDQETNLVAFPKYYRGHPAITTVKVTNYPTQRNAWAALMRGELDMLHEVRREAADFVERETTVKTYKFPRPYYIPLVFNVRHPVLKRADVRQAINEAVDRAALVRDGMSGRGRPADGPIPPEHWAYSPPATPFLFNPDSARQRLDSAGLKIQQSAAGTPVRFSFECLVFANDSRFERVALLVQKQLAEVGVDMRIHPVPQDELVPRLASGRFDAFLFEMAGRNLSWVYEFWRSKPVSMNNSGYRGADAVLDRIQSARTDDEIRSAVAELERVLHDDPPAAFLAWQETSRAVSAKIDVLAEPNRDVMTNIWMWRPATAAGTQASR